MRDNIFETMAKPYTLADYMNFNGTARSNLGDEIPVIVYRLLEYTLREELIEQFGKEAQVSVFRSAGYRAGTYFAKKLLDLTLPFPQFIAQLQKQVAEMKIGVLRVESADETTGKIVLSVAEDADCSGLPLLGETVCNYDEGFLAGILSTYTKTEYTAIEVDCWATGDRVCRFQAQRKE
jgi:predicted hydrocarbon binding protein